MSTNRTENYQLHVWGAEDEESLAEINENFAKLAGTLSGLLTTGRYQGDGAAVRDIELGFRPRAVLVLERRGAILNGSIVMGGLAVEGCPAGHSDQYFSVAITDTGFRISNGSAPSLVMNVNQTGYQYQYLVVA